MKRWHFLLGLIISAAFLWWALRERRLVDVWQVLRGAQYGWLIPGVGVYMLGVWVRSWRWHYLLRPLKQISTNAIFPVVAIGYMGNNIYPSRAGELLRAYVLRRREQVPISSSFATIVVERAFDGIVMLAFVFINLPKLAGLAVYSGFTGTIQELALWGAAAFLAAVVLFFLMAAFPEISLRIITRLVNRWVPNRFRTTILEFTKRFLGGLASLRSPRDVLMILLTSVVIWLLETGKYWFVMQAFTFRVSFFALMLMNGIVNLTTTIPSAPGYIGTFDAPGIALLEAFGVEGAVATGYTLVLHAALWLPITLLGAYFMAREGLSWRRVQAEVAQED